ncbi:hypothetical protein J6590_036436 [Homalodisca vitripennis]|nr:hypothetical protein J6590_036436 [Homalodisca vitripennis]
MRNTKATLFTYLPIESTYSGCLLAQGAHGARPSRCILCRCDGFLEICQTARRQKQTMRHTLPLTAFSVPSGYSQEGI